jgi:uncharacterized membrane protein (DUF485 family)
MRNLVEMRQFAKAYLVQDLAGLRIAVIVAFGHLVVSQLLTSIRISNLNGVWA